MTFFFFIEGRGVFGVSLSDSVIYAHSTISYIDDKTNSQSICWIPTIIAKCGAYLKDGGLYYYLINNDGGQWGYTC